MSQHETYDPVLRVDEDQSVRQRLPASLRAAGVGAVLVCIVTFIALTLHSI
jgi:hypothetical protein